MSSSLKEIQNKSLRLEEEVDISLLEHNLILSYEQRLQEHQRALDLVLEVEKAGRRYYGQDLNELRESSQNSTRS